MSLQTSEKFLQEIVSTVASSLELAEVLPAVVRLMSDASGVHGCFVYLLEDDRLVMRAASPPYERQAGKVAFERGESLAWWAVEHGEPAFIRDNALADPRVKYVPELEEERYQSLLAVPIVGRTGEPIGAITAHTEAPREFTDDEVDFIVTSASLVAGAIENARLYEETRLRVTELEQLTELAEAIARAEALDELLETVAADARPLLGARACHVYLLDPAREELDRVASDPEQGSARQTLGLAELGPELARGGRSTRLAIPLVAAGELIGLLVAEGSTRVELGRAIASQVAVGIKKVQVIEQLTEKNLIKDFFEELAGGQPAATSRDARRGSAATSTSRTSSLVAEPWSDALARALRVGGARLALRPPRGLAAGARAARRRRRASRSSTGCGASTATWRSPSRSASRACARGRPRSRTASPRRSRRSSARSFSRASRPFSPTTTSAPTSTSCASRSTAASATRRSTPSESSPSTTLSVGRSSSRRSRSSSAGTARSARPRRRCTSIRTRCASGCGGSPSSRGSTSGATTGWPSRSP